METPSEKKFRVTHLITAGLILVLTVIAAIPVRTAYSQSEPIGDKLRGGRLYAAWDNLAVNPPMPIWRDVVRLDLTSFLQKPNGAHEQWRKAIHFHAGPGQ